MCLLQLFGISFDALKSMPDFSTEQGMEEADDGLEQVPETPGSATIAASSSSSPTKRKNRGSSAVKWSTSEGDKILRTLRKMKAFIRLVDLQVSHTLADLVVKSVVAIKKHVDEAKASELESSKEMVTPFVILEADPEDKAKPTV